MSSKHERDKQKVHHERLQRVLYDLLRDEDNKYCVDCDAKGPRWASWNLGVFLCIRCAGIHRNLGVHVSRVKSVNLDSWTEEQVAMMQEMGNSRGRAVYEANIPDHFRRPQTDASLETFIRTKYEQKKYIAREWVPPKPKSVNFPSETSDIPKTKADTPKLKINKTKNLHGNQNKPTPIATQNMVSNSGQNTKEIKTSEINNLNKEIDLLGLEDPPLPENQSSTIITSSSSSSSSTVQNETKDIFGEFLSSQSEQSLNNISTTNNLETNLFETKSVANDNKKVSKDSILALYGSQQPQQQQQQQQQQQNFLILQKQQQLHNNMNNLNLYRGNNVLNGGLQQQQQQQQQQFQTSQFPQQQNNLFYSTHSTSNPQMVYPSAQQQQIQQQIQLAQQQQIQQQQQQQQQFTTANLANTLQAHNPFIGLSGSHQQQQQQQQQQQMFLNNLQQQPKQINLLQPQQQNNTIFSHQLQNLYQQPQQYQQFLKQQQQQQQPQQLQQQNQLMMMMGQLRPQQPSVSQFNHLGNQPTTTNQMAANFWQ